VGDSCCAHYTEDGQIYEATIISIDSHDRTCIICYDEYGNEEQQNLEDLIQSEKTKNDKGTIQLVILQSGF